MEAEAARTTGLEPTPCPADSGDEPLRANSGEPLRANSGDEPLRANSGDEPLRANSGDEPLRADSAAAPQACAARRDAARALARSSADVAGTTGLAAS